METAAEPIFDEDTPGSTREVGQTIDEGRGRIFPCSQCGADLVFSIGQQSMECPYCGHIQQLVLPENVVPSERDLEAMLERLAEIHQKSLEKKTQDDSVNDQPEKGNYSAVRCESCGGEVVFQGTLTSTTCPYCASPLQRDDVYRLESNISVDAVLPFLVSEQRAANNLREWVNSRWFAPNDFRKQGAQGKFNGCYLPFFTFDAFTFTRYSGQRGDHYYVTVGQGKDQRRERRTRWSSASGEFQRFFDDVLVVASRGVHADLIHELEPWPLAKCLPFNQQVIAGFFARTYDIPLKDCFQQGRLRMEAALLADCKRRIGGDEQRVDRRDSQYSALTFKYIMLPVWLLAYRYKDKTYQVVINAATGEVQGERPWSWVKITAAILTGLAIALTFAALSRS